MYLMKRYGDKEKNIKKNPIIKKEKKASLTVIEANKQLLIENRTLKKELEFLKNKITQHRDHLSYPLIFTDRNFTITYFNQAAKKIGLIFKLGDHLFDKIPELLFHKKELKLNSVTIQIQSKYFRFIQSYDNKHYNFYLYDETKTVLESLRINELEKTYSSLVFNIPGVVFRCHYSKEWTMKFMSEFTFELTGFKVSEFIDNKKRSFGSIIHEDNNNNNVLEINDAIKLGTSYEIEYRIITKTKKVKWVLEKGMPIFDDNNELLYLEGVLFDITDKKEKAFEIELNNRNYFNLLSRVNTGVFIYNKQLQLQYVNQTALDITGFKDFEEVSKENLIDYLDKEDLAIANERIALALKGNITPGKRYKAKRKGMVPYEAYIISAPIVFNNQSCIQISITDLTPLIEKEIFSREAQYVELLNRISSGVVIYDEDFKMQYANQTLLNMLNFESIDEYRKRDIFDNFHLESKDIARQRFLGIAKDDKISNGYTYSVLTRNNNKLEVFCLGSIITFNNKKCVQISVTDLTEINKFQSLIKQQRDNYLEMLNKMNLSVIIVNKKREIIYINETAKIVSGYNSETEFTEVLKNPHLPMQYFNEAIERVFNSNKPISYQTLSYKKNLEPYFIDVNVAQIQFDQQDCILVSFSDITKSKQQEELIKTQRDNYFNIIDFLPIGTIILNQELKYVFANDSAVRISGFKSKADFLNSSLLDYIIETEIEEALMALELVKQGPVGPVYFNARKQDGSLYEAEAFASMFIYEGEQCIHITYTDVSLLKKAEEEKQRAQALLISNNKLQREINDRLIAEAQLQNTRNYLRLLIESSRDMIVACDKDGYITEFNLAAQKTFGYELSEIIGTHFSELYATKSEYKRIFNTLGVYNSGFSGEIKNKRKNGTEFFTSLSATVLKNENNEIIGSMGVSRDITRMKEDEILLKDSEERYKAVFNQAFIGIARLDVNTGEFIEVNQHLCNMLGYKKSELLKLTNNQLTLEEDQNINLKVKVIENRKASFSVQKRYLHRDGQIVHINLSYSLVVDEMKRPLYFILVYDDLTDRIKYESEILKQSARLNAIFNSNSHLIWTLDNNGGLLSFNKNYAKFFKELYGVSPTEVNRIPLKTISNDTNFLKQWEKYFKISLKGHPTNFIAKNIDKQGNFVYRDIFINPVLSESGETIELSVIAHNISDKVQIQERLRKNIMEKETLLKEIHHRVKNNLQIISSMLNLQSHTISDPSTKKIFLDSQNRVKSMSIIHELLYNTKDFENIDFSKYINSLVSNLQQSYYDPRKEIKMTTNLVNLVLDLDNAIPSGLILNELISNAYKHAFFTLEKGNIFVEVKKDDREITFLITDDGIGLEDGYNLKNSLGLGLVYSLVGQLNGTIIINRDRGTQFIINYQI